MSWSTDDIPSLAGKTVLVTGANSGLGLASARVLARKGAHVLLACRTREKAETACDALQRDLPSAALEPLTLDLADLRSVRACAQQVVDRHPRLDLLLNNAGVMATPYLRTADGFELQFGTNHLGHFALTGLLFGLLASSGDARVVSVSSAAHRIGKLRLDDPHWERGYARWRAYGTSKLANLLFTYELARRCAAAGLALRSVAAHPGVAATNLPYRGFELAHEPLAERLARVVTPWVSQSAEQGALPQLFAATADSAVNGDYYGPSHMFETRGSPRKVSSTARSRDSAAMRKLWELSEELTGVHYAF